MPNRPGRCSDRVAQTDGDTRGTGKQLGLTGVHDTHWRSLVDRRRVVQLGSLIWAEIGAGVALGSLPDASEHARVLVGLASVIFPVAALCAAALLLRRRDRLAGLLLVVSAATPTYFAYPLNLPALVVGLALLATPGVVVGGQRLSVPR